MKLGVILGAIAGLALATILIVHFGWRGIVDAAVTAGWQGLLAITLIYFVCLLLLAAAWQALILNPPRNLFLSCLWSRWLRESVGNLLALLPTAGELAGARELTFHGVRPGMAGASSVVDVTLELVSQIAFTLIGLVLLLTWYRGQELSVWLAGGIGVLIFAAASFILAQRKGLFSVLERLTEKIDVKWAWNDLPGGEGIHDSIQAIYRHHRRIFTGFAFHLASWIVGTAEAWVALWYMGHPLPWSDVLILESVAFALRTATFIVPSRLGVQEGGYVVLGAMFGLTPDVALALSLLKRARELVTGVPCLIIWQGVEARRLVKRSASSQ
jgi:putative membrane protein